MEGRDYEIYFSEYKDHVKEIVKNYPEKTRFYHDSIQLAETAFSTKSSKISSTQTMELFACHLGRAMTFPARDES